MSDFIKGKRALVIGGTGGIGRAISVSLASLGLELIVHGGSSRDRLDAVIAECMEISPMVTGFIMDLRREEEFVDRIESLMPVDVLVFSAGPVIYKELDCLDFADWEFMVKSNFLIPSVVVSKSLGYMKKRGFGRIVLIGGNGTESVRGYRKVAAYSAAKTALGVVAKSVARNYSKYNISCNVLCPGVVMTEYQGKDDLPFAYEVEEHFFTKAEDIAEIVADIVKKEKPVLNGAIISVDKGFRA